MLSDTIFQSCFGYCRTFTHLYELRISFPMSKKTLFEILIGIHLHLYILGQLISKEYSNNEQGVSL